jgi:hypothetical protein
MHTGALRSLRIIPILLCAAMIGIASSAAEARPASHASPVAAVLTVVKTKLERTAHRAGRKVEHAAHTAKAKTARAFHAAGRKVKHAAHAVDAKASAGARAVKRKVRNALKS